MLDRIRSINESPVPANYEADQYNQGIEEQFSDTMETATKQWTGYKEEEQRLNDELQELVTNGDQDSDRAQEIHQRLGNLEGVLRDGDEVGALKLARRVAVKEVNHSADRYAEQVVMRHRQTAPIAFFNLPKVDGGEMSASWTVHKKADVLAQSQRDYQIALAVKQKIEDKLIEKEEDPADQERLKKESALMNLLGDGTDANKGELFHLNEEIRNKRLLHSGHYERDEANDTVVEKQSRYHKTMLKFYRGWNSLSEKYGRKGKIAKAATLVGVGAVVTATAGLAGVGAAGVVLVGAGTRLAKSAGTFFVDRNAGATEKAKAHATDVEESLESARADLEVVINSSSDIDFNSFIHSVITSKHTDVAHESYKQNQRRALFTVAGLAGGAALGKVVEVAADIEVGEKISKAWSWLGIPDQLEFWNDKTEPFIADTGDRQHGGNRNGGNHNNGGNHQNGNGGDNHQGGNQGNAHADRDVTVGNGDGYSQVFTDAIESQNDVDLTPEQSWDLYNYVNDNTHQGGNFFTGQGESYRMDDGNWGIASPGDAELRAHTDRLMRQWLLDNEDELEAA